MNLAAMTPRNELASTGYCLAHPGHEYLIYRPEGSEVMAVELHAGKYRYEWFHPVQGKRVGTGEIEVPSRSRHIERVLVEHCSLMGATDENVNTWGQVRDVTFQWTIIAEGRPPHSMGWLSGVGSDRITIHHCLFANNADRNPLIAGGLYDVVNNVIYNLLDDPDLGTRMHLAGNISPLTTTGAEDQWLNVTYYQRTDGQWITRRPAPENFRAGNPFPVDPVLAQPGGEAYELVLAHAGARVRNAEDLRVLTEIKSRTGREAGGKQ